MANHPPAFSKDRHLERNGPYEQASVWVGAAELAWLLLLAPLVLLPGRIVPREWHWVVVLLLLAFWPVRLWRAGAVIPRTPIRLVILALLFTLPVSIAVATDRTLAWESAGYLLYGMALAIQLHAWPMTQRQPQRIAWALLTGVLGLSLIGPLIVTSENVAMPLLIPIPSAPAPLAALIGETINPNILANALLTGFPIVLALAIFGGWSRAHRWGQAGAAMASLWLLLILLLTNSRGAWLAVAALMLVLLALRWPRLAYALPLLVVAVATLFLYRRAQILDFLSYSSTTNGFTERMEIWQRGLTLIHYFPLTGAGLGTFSELVPIFHPYRPLAFESVIPDAHNLPIQIGVDLGVPGLAAWLALMLILFAMAARVIRRYRNVEHGQPEERARQNNLRLALAAGALASLAGWLAAGIFSAAHWGVKPAFLIWLVVALIMTLYSDAEPDAATQPATQPATQKPEGAEANGTSA